LGLKLCRLFYCLHGQLLECFISVLIMGSLNAYEVIKAIGKGSYGEVHLIQHKQEKKQVEYTAV